MEENMKIMDFLYMLLGFESEDKNVIKRTKRTTTRSAHYDLKKDKKLQDNINGVPVYYPSSLEESKDYISMTKNQLSYFIDFKFVKSDERDKILDFIRGGLVALDASMSEIKKDRLYVVLPKGVELENVNVDKD